MDIMFVLVSITAFCALVGVDVAVRNQNGERAQDPELRRRRTDGTSSRVPPDHRVESLKHQAIGGRVAQLALLVACAATLGGRGNAQEVIHAISGTIVEANASTNYFSLESGDGSIIDFHAVEIATKPVTFDKDVRAQTIAATGQHLKGDHVLVFYYGYDAKRNAVAIKDLGQGDIGATTSTVEEFDRRHHEITVVTSGAGPTHITLTEHTVVDTPDGVIEGNKYHPNKGERVGVVFSTAAGVRSAVFIEATDSNANLI
jgi:VCBS repeat-containing protein